MLKINNHKATPFVAAKMAVLDMLGAHDDFRMWVETALDDVEEATENEVENVMRHIGGVLDGLKDQMHRRIPEKFFQEVNRG